MTMADPDAFQDWLNHGGREEERQLLERERTESPYERTLRMTREKDEARAAREAATPVGRYSMVQVGSRSYKIIRREDFFTTGIGDAYRMAVYRLSRGNFTLDGAMALVKKLNENSQARDYDQDGVEWIG